MNKVLTISLNGNAYQLEEAAYDKLRAYLDAARAKLAGNPDIEEIMRDLEQAIADKLHHYLSSHKSVANESDVEKVLAEMGPVDTTGEEAAAAGEQAPGGPKRLYRLSEQGVVFGVCAGIAAYLNLDVTIVRVATVALTIITGGGFVLAYFIAMMLIPEANTPAERQAAYGGTPITARDLIARAKSEYEKWDKSEWKAQKREMKRRFKQERKAWQHQGVAWQNRSWQGRPYRGPSLIGEVAQVLFLGLAIYLLYTYVPQTDPFFNHVWLLIQQGWSWIFAKLNTPVR
jgi:phage shock protein PspC (stress-responsive transcriptional regulator)